jgi:hypothetical protein
MRSIMIGDHGALGLFWPHAWDQRLMQPLLERLVDEGDADGIREFFEHTGRTPVLWWGCRWFAAFQSDPPDLPAALEALEHQRIHGPLDLQTLDLLVRTHRALGNFEEAAEHERLAHEITTWELARLRGALDSPLYRRGFIEDRLNYYLAMGYH